eukprot:362156-Chlamydomonas_euryale.AAC.23
MSAGSRRRDRRSLRRRRPRVWHLHATHHARVVTCEIRHAGPCRSQQGQGNILDFRSFARLTGRDPLAGRRCGRSGSAAPAGLATAHNSCGRDVGGERGAT